MARWKESEDGTPPSKFYGEIEEIQNWVEINFQAFKNFSKCDYPPTDHHFIDKPYDPKPAPDEEWETLRQSLPGNIFVRVYESRIDLMRAVIVGRESAPYHQGLFFFDIFFPSNYPTHPPQLFYHSYGLDSNLNLPKSGNFLLAGDSKLETLILVRQLILSEIEVPLQNQLVDINLSLARNLKRSMSKILISFRQLILSEMDEVPNQKQLAYSINYKEHQTFVQTCEAMIRMLSFFQRRANDRYISEDEKDFDDFVLGYFRTRAHYILLNYKAYADLEDEAMKLLFFKLVSAFENNGNYCKHHYKQEEYDLAFQKEELSDN